MNENLAFAIGIFVFIVGLSLALIALGAFLMEWRKDEEEFGDFERRLQASENAVAASVRPHTGLVEVSNRRVPYDWQTGPTRAELDFVYGLHLIDSAFDKTDWDRALGDGRH